MIGRHEALVRLQAVGVLKSGTRLADASVHVLQIVQDLHAVICQHSRMAGKSGLVRMIFAMLL